MTDLPKPGALPPEGRQTRDVDPAHFLHRTYYLDFDHPDVRAFALERSAGAVGDVAKAVKLFYAVRDEIRYNPYSLKIGREYFRASFTLGARVGWCVPKGVLMAALCRAIGIPARLGYADVRNHLASQRLIELMDGSDLFSYHGYAELWLNGRWIKTTPVFDIALCTKFKVKPQDFDGSEDALFQQHSVDGRRHMEYVHDHGPYDDLPYEEILGDFDRRYTKLMKLQRAQQLSGDMGDEAAAQARKG